MTNPPRPRTSRFLLLITAALVCVILFLRFGILGGVAPTPALFSDGLTLEAAQARAAETGRPVLIVSTSDSCLPCQIYKRGALADPALATRIRSAMLPVYLNIDDHPQTAGQLGIAAIPTTQVMIGGHIAHASTGVLSADELERQLAPWLDTPVNQSP